MSKIIKVIAGLVAATAVGVAVGVAFAPHKGTKTRRKIKGKLEDLKEDTFALTEDVKELALKQKELAIKKVDDFTDQTKKAFESITSKITNNKEVASN